MRTKRRHARAIALHVALACACGAREERFAAPDGAGVGGALVLLGDAQGLVRAVAGTADGALSLELEVASADARLVLVETPSLEALGVSAGPIAVGAPGGCALRKALGPRRAWARAGEVWQPLELDELEALYPTLELRTARCALADECLPLEARSVPLGGDSRPLWTLAIDDATLLVGTLGPFLARITPDGTITRVALSPRDRGVRALWRDASGGLRASDQDGELLRARLTSEPALELEPFGRAPADVIWATPITTGTTAAQLMLDSEGHLGTAGDGLSWRTLRTIGDAGELTLTGGMAPLGAKDVLLGWIGDQRLYRYLDGAVLDVTPPGDLESVTALALLDAPYALTGNAGQAHRWSGERWEGLGEPLGVTIYAAARWRDANFLAGSNGFLVQVERDGSPCPPTHLEPITIRALVPFAGGLVALAGDPSARNNRIHFLSAR